MKTWNKSVLFLTTSNERETEATFSISPNFFLFQAIFYFWLKRAARSIAFQSRRFLCMETMVTRPVYSNTTGKLQKTRCLRRGEKYLSTARCKFVVKISINNRLSVINIPHKIDFYCVFSRTLLNNCDIWRFLVDVLFLWSIFCFDINKRWKNRAGCGCFGC